VSFSTQIYEKRLRILVMIVDRISSAISLKGTFNVSLFTFAAPASGNSDKAGTQHRLSTYAKCLKIPLPQIHEKTRIAEMAV
jgi:hypothetical protein